MKVTKELLEQLILEEIALEEGLADRIRAKLSGLGGSGSEDSRITKRS